MPTTEQLSENSHQGFEGIKASLCLAEIEAKSNRASGIPACLRPNGTGSRCSGKERDAESGLDYFRARYDSGPQGRFTSPDPVTATPLHAINPQRWNRYVYGVNNPLFYVDPDGRDAIAVNFAKPANHLGHAGIASVHDDGRGTYADFGPKHTGRFHDEGSSTFIDFKTQIKYGSDGKPTKESLTALANELADDELQPRDSVSVVYFKTSGQETIALDAYINAAKEQQAQGRTPSYWAGFRDCIGFSMNGLAQAGVGPGSAILDIPNLEFLGLRWLADAWATGTKTPDPESGHKRNRKPPCLRDSEGNCVQ